MMLLLAACQPQPRAGTVLPERSDAPPDELGWAPPWHTYTVPEDLDRLYALAYAVRTVLDEAEAPERDRVLAPYWGFGPTPLLCASSGTPAAPTANTAWQQEEIYLVPLLAALEEQWKSDQTAVAALFAGPDVIARASRRIRKPASKITLVDLRRRLRRADRAKLDLADEVLRRANIFAMAWPVERSFRVTSRFGMRVHPVTGREVEHLGVDVATPEGTQVRAAAAGVVRRVRKSGGNGLWIEVEHGGGVRTQYLHLSAFLVKRGQKVAAGDVIGLSGATGRVTGPHLHYQVVHEDEHLDPLALRIARELASQPLVRSSTGRDPRTALVVDEFLDRALGAEPVVRDALTEGAGVTLVGVEARR